jgi:hypothetical protein
MLITLGIHRSRSRFMGGSCARKKAKSRSCFWTLFGCRSLLPSKGQHYADFAVYAKGAGKCSFSCSLPFCNALTRTWCLFPWWPYCGKLSGNITSFVYMKISHTKECYALLNTAWSTAWSMGGNLVIYSTLHYEYRFTDRVTLWACPAFFVLNTVFSRLRL